MLTEGERWMTPASDAEARLNNEIRALDFYAVSRPPGDQMTYMKCGRSNAVKMPTLTPGSRTMLRDPGASSTIISQPTTARSLANRLFAVGGSEIMRGPDRLVGALVDFIAERRPDLAFYSCHR